MKAARLASLALCAIGALAQSPTTLRYFYDDGGELYSVLDSTGTLIQYTYDASGNITQVSRSTVPPNQLFILNVTPSSAVVSTATIVGQDFSAIAANDIVKIGGVTAIVISATATQLVVQIPGGTAGGAVSVTVGGVTATWSNTITTNPQTITFDAIPKRIFGISPFPIAARASSGLPISTVSTTSGVCKTSDDMVMLLGAGTCSITASQGGNPSYAAATSVTRSFIVSDAKPSGSFLAAAGSPIAVGNQPVASAVADFNGDGVPDLAVIGNPIGLGFNTVAVLLGNGSGGFTAAQGSPFTVGTAAFSVVAGDFNGDGAQDLAIANYGGNNVTVLLGNGSGGFTAAQGSPFAVGIQPASMAVGDFNGDGIQDLAIANYGGNNVTVLLGNGSGVFASAAASPFSVGASPRSVTVGDFNGDGIDDIAVANEFSDNVTVLLGNGSGGFKAATGSPFAVASPIALAVGDFNRDGVQDLAAGSLNNNVTVMLGNGSGGFTAAQGSPFAVGTDPYLVLVGDFNGDGIQDIATANDGSNNVTVLLGNGSGGFTAMPGSPWAVGTFPISVAVADFNGDGIEDLATTNAASNDLTVLLGLVVGDTPQEISFGPLSTVTYGVPPFAIAATTSSGLAVSFASTTSSVCTVAGSTVTIISTGICSIIASQAGNATYAAASTVAQSFTVNLGSQTITFSTLSNVAFTNAPIVLTATASSGLSVSFISTTATVCTVLGNTATLVSLGNCSIAASQPGNVYYAAATPVTQTFPVGIGSQTISFDAIPNQISGISPFEIAVQSSSSLSVGIVSTTPAVCKSSSGLVMLLSAGTCSMTASQPGNTSYSAATSVTRNFTVNLAKPAFTFVEGPGSPLTVGANPETVVVGDFNGDGIQDLAIANDSSGNVTVLLGNGSGGFTAATGSPFPVGTDPGSVVVGDFNGDGIQDLATANYASGNVTVLLGNGSGGFTAAAGSPFAAAGAASVVVGDFNGDGIQDLAVTNQNGGNVTVLLGNGTGGFTPATGSPFAVGTGPHSVVVGDFNADGIQDLAVANLGSNTVTVLLGNGTGGFASATGSPFAVGTGPHVVVGDFNGDGIQDLATANSADNNVTVLLGNGSGGFTPAMGSPFAVGSVPYSLAVGDFNGDGIQDLAVANVDTNNVTILLGNGSGGFTPAIGSPFAVGTGPQSVTVGDFNGDGIQDLAAANFNGGNITVLLGVAAQTIIFGPLSNVTFGVPPFMVAATASSGLAVSFASTTSAVCTVSGNTVTVVGGGSCSIVASQAGNGSYLPAAMTQTLAVNQALQTIAFNQPGNVGYGAPPFTLNATATSGLEVTFASTTPGVCTVTGSTVSIMGLGTCSITASQAGNANYTAATSVTRTFTVNQGSQTISFDAIPNQIFGISPFEIAVQASSGLAIGFTSTTLAVCENSSGMVTLLRAGTCSITASQPGNADYSAATPATRSFTVSLAKPSGPLTVATGSPFEAGVATCSLAVGDFNGDGIPDLAAANSGSGNVTVLLGNGSGGFTQATGSPFAVGSGPSSVVVGDFNGDGIQDLAAANAGSNNVTVLLGNGSGGFTPATGSPFALGSGPFCVAVGDFNGDGIQDLAVANIGSGTVTVLLGNGSGGFTAAMGSPFTVGKYPESVAVGDFNGDGIQDLAVANTGSGTVTVLLGNGTGGFTMAAGSPYLVESQASSVVVGDFNGDGIQDLAVSGYGSSLVTVLLGNGSGGFTAGTGGYAFGGEADLVSLAVGDFNGDGIQDVAAADDLDGNVAVLLGNGSGGFTQATGSPFSVAGSPFFVVAGDFNGDGVEDIATPNDFSSNVNEVTVLLGNGSGGFAAITGHSATADDRPISVAAADVNQDDTPSLAIAK